MCSTLFRRPGKPSLYCGLLVLLAVMPDARAADDRPAQEKAALAVLRALPRSQGATEFGLAALHFPGNHNFAGAAFSPTANIVAGATLERITFWDLNTGNVLRSFPSYPMFYYIPSRIADRLLTFSPDGKLLALCCSDKTVRVLRADSGELVQTLECADNPKRAVFSTDGSTLSAVMADLWPDGKKAYLVTWKTSTWARKELKIGRDMQSAWAFSPDGRWFAYSLTTSDFKKVVTNDVEVWDLVTGKRLIVSPKLRNFGLGLSADGSTLLVSAQRKDGNFTESDIWAVNVKSGEAQRLAEVNDRVTAIEDACDGKHLMLESYRPPFSTPFRLIERATGKELWSGWIHGPMVFSPGRQLIAYPFNRAVELLAFEDMLQDAWADSGADIAKARQAGHRVDLYGKRIDVRAGRVENLATMTALLKAVPATTHLEYAGVRPPIPGILGPLKDLPRLEELNLSRWTPGRGDTEGLRDLKQLRRLTLAHSENLTDENLAPLAGLEALESLSMTDLKKVSDEGLRPLAALKNLRRLHLAEMKITNAGLAHLKDLEQLRELYLDRTMVRDVSLANFKEWRNLERLALPGCLIRDDQLASLAGLTNLIELNLSSTGLSNAGLAHLKGLTNLKVLRLSGNYGLTSAGLQHLKELTRLETLDLDYAVSEDEALAVLANFPRLRRLNLTWSRIDDDALKHLGGLGELTELHLSGTDVRGPGLAQLRGCKKLVELHLGGTRIHDKGLAGIAQLRQVKVLQLPDKVTDAGLVHLKGLDALEELTVHANVRGEGLRHLKDLPNLQRLHGLTGVDDEGLASLQGLTWIIDLDLSRSRITARGCTHLRGLPNLRDLKLPAHPSITKEELEGLKKVLPLCWIYKAPF
jgi:internalin A